MKKIIVTILLFVGIGAVNAQEINWVTLNEALELQKENPKKIIMDVYTNWCGPCKMLDKNTFHNKDVVDYINENYYAVKFNGEGNQEITYDGESFGNPNYQESRKNRRNSAHEFARYMRIDAYPTLVFFDEGGDFIVPLKGYQNPQQLELYLKFFVSVKQKEKSLQQKFDTYKKNFKATFKS